MAVGLVRFRHTANLRRICPPGGRLVYGPVKNEKRQEWKRFGRTSLSHTAEPRPGGNQVTREPSDEVRGDDVRNALGKITIGMAYYRFFGPHP
ncbi:hypothetical protein VTH82DRAFT_3659 [Thermothelomyces myriococcoides]